VAHRTHSHFSRFGLVLLALLALGWGLNWPIMKIVLQEVPPLTFRGVCLLAGGLGILLIARLVGERLTIPRAYWGRLALLSACNIIGWNVFAIYGVALLPSGRAALLGYTMPLWSITFSTWLLHEPLTRRRIGGLALGMLGVATLMGPDVVSLHGAGLGALLMLGAALVWGLGVVLLKRFAVPAPTITLTAWLMLSGGVPIALAALVLEHAAWHPVTLGPALGLLYNALVAFMFCYWAWNRIVLMVPVAVSSLSSLITPVIGVVGGMWMLGERPGWHEFLAGVLILAAIALVLNEPRRQPIDMPPD
jgi:drug/metabolite transporter (DMT)-like permease